jgi:hypothetical protein
MAEWSANVEQQTLCHYLVSPNRNEINDFRVSMAGDFLSPASSVSDHGNPRIGDWQLFLELGMQKCTHQFW